jgi:hypothetical protein
MSNETGVLLRRETGLGSLSYSRRSLLVAALLAAIPKQIGTQRR